MKQTTRKMNYYESGIYTPAGVKAPVISPFVASKVNLNLMYIAVKKLVFPKIFLPTFFLSQPLGPNTFLGELATATKLL